MLETLKNWDRELLIYLNNLGSENFDTFWIIVTRIESWVFLFLFFLFIIFKFYKKREAVWVSLFTILTFFVSFGLKFFIKGWVQRLRPNNISELSENLRILQFPIDFSFFSGHASVSFAVTTFIVLSLHKFSKWTYLFFIWPLLFSFSRIYVGVHYPSDILSGALIGIIIGRILYFFLHKSNVIEIKKA